MHVTIDRFEGKFAIVELPDRTIVNMPAELLEGAKEGDIVRIEIDRTTTNNKKASAEERANNLWKD